MDRVKLSVLEILSMLLLFLLGSTIIVGWNFENEQDTWIVIIVSNCIGIGVLYFYLWLHSAGNCGSLYNMLELGFGKIAGKLLSFVYVLYFCYIGGRVLRDFSFFISKMLFQNVAPWIISFSFICMTGYICYLGVEAFARGFQILTFVTLLQIIIFVIAGYASNAFVLKNLYPVFQHRWDSIVRTIFPTNITFPYGEMVVFTVLFPLTNHMKNLRKYGWIPVVIAGFTLLVAGEMVLGILHPKLVGFYLFPFIKALEAVNTFGFIQNFEIFAVLVNLVGGCIKITVFAYAALVGASQIITTKKENWKIIGVCVLIYGFSFLFSGNVIQHLYVGLKIVPIYLHIPLQFIIPFALAMLLLLKKNTSQTRN